jgi:isopenicillin N synthase-like dioxygenase
MENADSDEENGSVLGKECARLLAEKGFCIAPFMHDGVSDAVNQLLREGGPADIFFSMDSATALLAAEEEEEEEEEEDELDELLLLLLPDDDKSTAGVKKEKKKKKKKGGWTRRGFWQAGPRRSVMRMVIGQELPGAKALQPNATGGHKAAAARAVAQQMQAAMQQAGEAMRGMAEGALREIAQELGGEDVMHLVDTYGRGGSTVQAILTVSMISGEVAPEDERESVADCGMHKDRGLLTLVCSREGKGLSVRAHENSMSTWTDDAEHKDMVTVLGGHVLERVSLGRARAAEHAVFSRGGERLSVALTLRPAEGQSVRVNGAMVAADDVMGELDGSVNEPKSEE